MGRITDQKIDHWRRLLGEESQCVDWVKQRQQVCARRSQVQQEICTLLNQYLEDEISTEKLRTIFDGKTRSEWDVFGLKGMSGAMFLNKLVKHLPDQVALTEQLKAVLLVPNSVEDGRGKMEAFANYLEQEIQSGTVSRGQIQPARIPFFVGAWWHMQNKETWPIFYISALNILGREGLYSASENPVHDYFSFRETFVALAESLGLNVWELERLCVWLDERANEKDSPSPAVKPPDAVPEEKEKPSHTHVQGLLAEIGLSLGCQVWIAANDRSQVYKEQKLGDMSIAELPMLGLEPYSQKIVELIDVLWIKGTSQIVAAFEIEHTTSVFSGLLRMADLCVLSPNLNFSLYIVAPEARMEKVANELKRPSFQQLEVHKRCAYFSEESLLKAADSILKWAESPTAIDKLSKKVSDNL